MQALMAMCFVIGLSACTPQELAVTKPNHGEVMTSSSSLLAWDEVSKQWVSPYVFWHNEMAAKGGVDWAQNTAYPPYDKLNEFVPF